jgi:hypothetical protein
MPAGEHTSALDPMLGLALQRTYTLGRIRRGDKSPESKRGDPACPSASVASDPLQISDVKRAVLSPEEQQLTRELETLTAGGTEALVADTDKFVVDF